MKTLEQMADTLLSGEYESRNEAMDYLEDLAVSRGLQLTNANGFLTLGDTELNLDRTECDTYIIELA